MRNPAKIQGMFTEHHSFDPQTHSWKLLTSGPTFSNNAFATACGILFSVCWERGSFIRGDSKILKYDENSKTWDTFVKIPRPKDSDSSIFWVKCFLQSIRDDLILIAYGQISRSGSFSSQDKHQALNVLALGKDHSGKVIGTWKVIDQPVKGCEDFPSFNLSLTVAQL